MVSQRDGVYRVTCLCPCCPQPVPPSPVEENQVWLAVNEDGLCVLDLTMVATQNSSVHVRPAVAGAHVTLCSQNTLVTYAYQCVVTFGGCRDDFMVVTSQQGEPGVGRRSLEKLVFAMAKPKVGSSGTHTEHKHKPGPDSG